MTKPNTNYMKPFSLLSFLGATLCILWACDPVEINDPINGKDNGEGNQNDSTQVNGNPNNPDNGGNNGGNNNTSQDTVDWNDPDWYTVNFWDRTDRQKAGLRGPVKKWHINNYTTYDEYEYDRAGHLIKQAYIDTDDEDYNHEWRYTYDAQGHCVKAEYFDIFCEGEPSTYWEYEYENTGKFVAREWFMMGPEISNAENGICKDLSKATRVSVETFYKSYDEYTYTFRNDSLVISEHSYRIYLGSEDKEYEESIEYSYAYKDGYPKSLSSNKLCYKVDNITYYSNGMYKDFVYREENAYNSETGWDVHSYTMLDNPRYLEVDTFSLGGRASYMSLTPQSMKKTYDSHFDIVKNEEWYTTNTDTVATYIDTWVNYTYDKYGNWVTRDETVVARYTGQESTTTINRVMEYFE